jgi:thiamine-phosphate pyrophosphorylase
MTSGFPRLCVICDADVCGRAGWTLPDYAAACLDGGARFLQVRAKHAASGWLLETTEAVVRRAEPFGALVLVNDRADIAALAGAGGVHVGQDDLSPADARRVVGAGACVGLSTHTAEQLDAALREPVSYVAAGPVFSTSTKDTGYAPLGLRRIAEIAAVVRGRLPLVAIGGITLDTAADVLAAGAHAVAVIGDLLAAGDPRARVRQYVERL